MNTPKQLILDFHDCKNDNFHLKILIVFLFVVVVVVVVFFVVCCCSKINC